MTTRRIEQAARQLLDDIDAMRVKAAWYGGFSVYIIGTDDMARVEWPNLAISAANLQQALEEER